MLNLISSTLVVTYKLPLVKAVTVIDFISNRCCLICWQDVFSN